MASRRKSPLLLLLPLLLLPFVRPLPAAAEQEGVARSLQPAFVPELEGPSGVWFGQQKPWREPRELTRRPRAVRAVFLPGYPQEPQPAVTQGEPAQPEEAAFVAEPTFVAESASSSLLDAIRGGPDAPALADTLRFGLTADLITAFTEADDAYDEYNRMRLRGARLDLAADVDAYAALFASLEFGDVADGFLLREAGVRVGGLVGGRVMQGLSLRAGRFYADLGAWNTMLDDAHPAPYADLVRETVFGGNLALTGVNLHHDLPFGWGHFRWSAALASDAERHSTMAAQPESDPVGSFGRRAFDNAISTARVALQLDISEDVSWRFGASGLYTPEETSFAADAAGNVVREQQEHGIWGFDTGVLYRLPGSQAFHEFAFDLWLDDAEFDTATASAVSDPRRGEALLYRLVRDEHWSCGVQLSRVDEPQLVEIDRQLSMHQAFVTYAFTEGNRLTFFGTHVNPGPELQKFFTVGFEWTLEVGATRGGGIPRWRGSAVTAAAGAEHPIARLGM